MSLDIVTITASVLPTISCGEIAGPIGCSGTIVRIEGIPELTNVCPYNNIFILNTIKERNLFHECSTQFDNQHQCNKEKLNQLVTSSYLQ